MKKSVVRLYFYRHACHKASVTPTRVSSEWSHHYLNLLSKRTLTKLKRSHHQIGQSAGTFISSHHHHGNPLLTVGRTDPTFSITLRCFSQSSQRERLPSNRDENTLNVSHCQNARDLSMMIRSNGRSFYHRQDFELLQQQVKLLISKTTRMTPAQVAGLMNAVSRLSTVAKSQQRQTLFHLSQVALPLLKDCQVKELCMILNSIARKNVRNEKLFQESSLLLLSEQMNPQDLAVVSNAFARLHHKIPVLFDRIAVQAIPQLQEFSPQGLANLVNAFAKQDHSHPNLFDAVARQVEERLLLHDSDTFTPQGLANIVNAFGKMNHSDSKMFTAVANSAIPILHEFNAQNLSNTANAYAKMNHGHPELFHAIRDAALDKMPSFNAQELANLANAFVKNMDDTTNDHPTTRLLQEIVQAAIPLLSSFKAQELSMLLNAVTKQQQPIELRGDVQQFWEASAQATIALLPVPPTELCIMANAFSKAPIADSSKFELFDKIAEAAMPLLSNSPLVKFDYELQPQNLSNLANAYARINLHHVDMFYFLILRASEMLEEMNPQELANFTSAIAKLRIKGPQMGPTDVLFSKTAALLKSDHCDLASWESRNLVEVAYAFLKAFQTDEDVLERIGSELGSRPTLELDAVGLGHLAAILSQTRISCSKELLGAIFTSFECIPQERIQISNLADISKAVPLAYELEVVSDMEDFFQLIVRCAIDKRHEASPSDVRDLLLNLTSPRLDSSMNGNRNAILNLQKILLVAYQPIFDDLCDQIATKHRRTIRRAYKRLSAPT